MEILNALPGTRNKINIKNVNIIPSFENCVVFGQQSHLLHVVQILDCVSLHQTLNGVSVTIHGLQWNLWEERTSCWFVIIASIIT